MPNLRHPDVLANANRLASQLAANKRQGRPLTTAEVVANPKRGLPQWWCGLCPATYPVGDRAIRDHNLSHRPRNEAELAELERNRAAARSIFRQTAEPCRMCGRDDLKPGDSHLCAGAPPAVIEQERKVREWQRAGLKAAIDELDKE